MRTGRQNRILMVLLVAALLMVCLAALLFGSVMLSAGDFRDVFTGKAGYATTIVVKLRLPRVLGAVLSGMALSMAGLLLQTVTDNDLCSPNIIGANAGAGLGVMVTVCFFSTKAAMLEPILAYCGTLLAVGLVLLIGRTTRSHAEGTGLILAGIAVSAMLNAVTSMLQQLMPDAVESYTYFIAGSFRGVALSDLVLPAVIIVPACIASVCLADPLSRLCLGDDLARNLGVPVRRVRLAAVLLSSAMTAASVTYAGMLSFVGLIVPHAARRLFGRELRTTMPGCMLLGALLTVLSDLIGRTLFAPGELSAGIFLSLLGAPFFVVLLYRRRLRHD